MTSDFLPPPPRDGRTNVLAILSLVFGALGLSCCVCPPIGLAGVVCGVLALNQIKTTGEAGRPVAIIGIIVGAVSIVLGLAVLGVGFATDPEMQEMFGF